MRPLRLLKVYCEKLSANLSGMPGVGMQSFRLATKGTNEHRLVPSSSTPGAVLFTHVFRTIFLQDDPLYVVGNGHHLEFCTVPIGFSAQLFHYLYKPVVVTGNKDPALIEAWLVGASCGRPVRSLINLIQGIPLS